MQYMPYVKLNDTVNNIYYGTKCIYKDMFLSQSQNDGLLKEPFRGLITIEDHIETYEMTFYSAEEMDKSAAIKLLANKI